MGIVSSLLSQSKNKMKFLLVVVLLAGVQAEAEPEADPQVLLYGAVGAVPHIPTVKVVETKPAEVKSTVVPYALGYHGLGYGYPYTGLTYTGLGYNGLGYWPYGLLPAVTPAAAEEAPAVEAERKKREAEAEADPEADPWLYYSGLHHPLVYTAPVTTTVKAAPVKTYTYSTLGYPYGYGLGYGGLGYAGLGYHGYLGYHGLPYLVPATAAKEEDAPAVEAERKKREADPEADPAVLASYSRLLTAPTPLIHAPTTYTIPTVAHGVYAGYGYGYGLGAYGYGYPYAYGK